MQINHKCKIDLMGFLLCNYQHYVFDKVRFRTRIGSTPSRNAVNLPNTLPPHNPCTGQSVLINLLPTDRQGEKERKTLEKTEIINRFWHFNWQSPMSELIFQLRHGETRTVKRVARQWLRKSTRHSTVGQSTSAPPPCPPLARLLC